MNSMLAILQPVLKRHAASKASAERKRKLRRDPAYRKREREERRRRGTA